MKIGDVITEEPTKVGTIVRDGDGDLYELTGKGWPDNLTWASIQKDAPITVAHLPRSTPGEGDDQEWEEVQPDDLRVGDEVKVIRCGEVTEVSPGSNVVLVGGMAYHTRTNTFRRRLVRDMPEPGAPALVVHAGRAFTRPNVSTARSQWRDVTGDSGRWFTWVQVLDLDRTAPPRVVPWHKILEEAGER